MIGLPLESVNFDLPHLEHSEELLDRVRFRLTAAAAGLQVHPAGAAAVVAAEAAGMLIMRRKRCCCLATRFTAAMVM